MDRAQVQNTYPNRTSMSAYLRETLPPLSPQSNPIQLHIGTSVIRSTSTPTPIMNPPKRIKHSPYITHHICA